MSDEVLLVAKHICANIFSVYLDAGYVIRSTLLVFDSSFLLKHNFNSICNIYGKRTSQ